MAFLTEAELISTRSHQEIIDAITEGDATIVATIISEQIGYMKGYLRSRFDAEAIFSQTGTGRDSVVLMILKNLVIYEVYSKHNPQMMTDLVERNHTLAVDWLKSVQAQQINPDLPVTDSSDPITYIEGGGNTRRSSYY